MATTSQLLTSEPASITEIVEGKSYSVQNVGNRRTVFLAEASSVPGPDDASHILEYGEWAIVKLPTNELAYAWTQMGTGKISVTMITTP